MKTRLFVEDDCTVWIVQDRSGTVLSKLIKVGVAFGGTWQAARLNEKKEIVDYLPGTGSLKRMLQRELMRLQLNESDFTIPASAVLRVF